MNCIFYHKVWILTLSIHGGGRQKNSESENEAKHVEAEGAAAQLSCWDNERVISRHSDIINSLAPRRFERNFREGIFKLILVIDGLGISCETVLTWTSQDLTDDKSTLVQVMDWCRQATSHYLSQCWPSSLSPYGVTRAQWVNTLRLEQNGSHFADNIFKYTLSHENFVFRFIFHWSLFPMVQSALRHCLGKASCRSEHA